jgi:monoamine oxidase
MLQLQLEFVGIMEETADAMDLRVFDEFQEEFDVTFAEWIALNATWDTPEIYATARQLSTAIVGREPDDIGFHYWLDYLKAGRGIQSLLSEGSQGAQGQMIKTGTLRPADFPSQYAASDANNDLN